MPRIGVLAIQGDFAAHMATLHEAELRPVAVVLAGVAPGAPLERVGEELPLLASAARRPSCVKSTAW